MFIHVLATSLIVFKMCAAQSELKECLLTSYTDFDGFGYQFEGKMSCIIADVLHPRLSYIHIPLKALHHIPKLVKEAEEFTNMGYGSFTEKDLQTMCVNKSDVSVSKYNHFEGNITREISCVSTAVKAAFEEFPCKPGVIYCMMNCWNLIYYPPMVYQIDEAKDEIRRRYFASPKPVTGFEKNNRFNVAIHIRRGDAESRSYPVEFYLDAINYIRKNITHMVPMFWIYTDDLDWEGHDELFDNAVQDDIRAPRPNENIFQTFHRMVMADAFIASDSTLSYSAIHLSTSNLTIIPTLAPGQDRTTREDWFQTSRFTRIPIRRSNR